VRRTVKILYMTDHRPTDLSDDDLHSEFGVKAGADLSGRGSRLWSEILRRQGIAANRAAEAAERQAVAAEKAAAAAREVADATMRVTGYTLGILVATMLAAIAAALGLLLGK